MWLFLDYDGTLVPIAPRPVEARPDPALLHLLARLADAPRVRTAILSGRPLVSLQEMLPIPRLVLAGLYGLEVRMPDGTVVYRADRQSLRRVVDQVKSAWSELVQDQPGFLVEDKGLSVALHSRLATPADAARIVPQAHTAALACATPDFRIVGGNKFIEVAPAVAHKGQSVEWLLQALPFPGALPVYLGDDSADEDAFEVIRRAGGIPVLVGPRESVTGAERLAGPSAARGWIALIVDESGAAHG